MAKDGDSPNEEIAVKVKWGRQIFQEVPVDFKQTPGMFRQSIYELTGVLPERQKIMVKGALLQESWSSVKLSPGITILLMGSKEDLPQEPLTNVRFVEDMNEAEIQKVANKLESGLTNLGNTCYVNATVQCLKSVPELRQALNELKESFSRGLTLAPALRDLYATMDNALQPVPPLLFLEIMQNLFPRFREKMDNGSFVQQDANEFWVQLVLVLQEKLSALKKDGFLTQQESCVDQYFGGTFQTELRCLESEDEPVTTSEESFLQLSCFISQDVKYLLAGLKSKMEEKITKRASVLDKDAAFIKTSKIKRLPAYLTVQFVRFYYKEKEGVNAKILKDIKFPLELDVFDLCSSDLQKKLGPIRQKFKDLEDFETQLKCGGGKPEECSRKEHPFSFKDDLGSNNSGYYSLKAVLTHKGRSSTSGHYAAWVKESEESWIKCDDECLSRVSPDEILKLSGGGDWHCAYVLLYGPKVLKTPLEMKVEEGV